MKKVLSLVLALAMIASFGVFMVSGAVTVGTSNEWYRIGGSLIIGDGYYGENANNSLDFTYGSDYEDLKNDDIGAYLYINEGRTVTKEFKSGIPKTVTFLLADGETRVVSHWALLGPDGKLVFQVPDPDDDDGWLTLGEDILGDVDFSEFTLAELNEMLDEELEEAFGAGTFRLYELFYEFEGPSINESVSIGGSSIPKGVNGEDLYSVRVAYDRDRESYSIILSTIDNKTVEISGACEVTATFVKVVNKITYTRKVSVWGNFKVLNARYSSSDVLKDAKGNYYINASDGRPVVDEYAFDKALNKSLTIYYPNYTITFPTVKNQNIALYLGATVSKSTTVLVPNDKPIIQITFAGIYLKDAATISVKIGADAQNYKGINLFAYKVDEESKTVINDTEKKVTVDAQNGVLLIEIPANTILGASGKNAKADTWAIFPTPQDGTTVAPSSDAGGAASSATSSGTNNPGTGAGEAVNVASVFAVVSLAAAGFVALKKVGK